MILRPSPQKTGLTPLLQKSKPEIQVRAVYLLCSNDGFALTLAKATLISNMAPVKDL